MNVFVTGGTGLVGSHVIELLCRSGHNVRALVRDISGAALVESLGAEAVLGSVEEEDAWTHVGNAEAIVHSAAIITARWGWDAFRRVNVDGAENAALAAAKRGIRLVHISSVAVYGRVPTDSERRIEENTEWGELRATEFYALSKRHAEQSVAAVVRKMELSAVCIRPCVVYGERDRTFLPPVMRILRYGFAPLVGAGTNSLAVVYAGNVATAVVAALVNPEVTGPVNVANDGIITQREFLTAVGCALGNKTRLIRVPVTVAYALVGASNFLRRALAPGRYKGPGASAVRFLTRDNPYVSERARVELGWRPNTHPKDAIERSVRWLARAPHR